MPGGTVIVTGASTGIGEATALHLKELGFDVVGAVRKDEDAARLRSSGLRSVKLDVADQSSIAAARQELGDAPLAGLVNNAGIAVAGPLEFLPLDQLRLQLEVNLVGQLAVIQQFLPALRAARGRIVNVSSIGGRVALPLFGPYSASKFALEGMSDALRRELRPHGVDVILIEPGGVKTPIWRKGNETADEIQSTMPPDAERLYGPMIAAARRATTKIAQETGHRAARSGGGDRQRADCGEAAHALPRGHRREDARAAREVPARPADGPRDRARALARVGQLTRPGQRERHGHATQRLPLRLQLDPAVVHDALAHLEQRPAGRVGGGHVVAQQVQVRLDRDRLARRAVVVRRHAGAHDELRVVADEHERARCPGQARGLGVERVQVGQVLVDERADDEVIGAAPRGRSPPRPPRPGACGRRERAPARASPA